MFAKFFFVLTILTCCIGGTYQCAFAQSPLRDDLWEAVRNGDAAQITKLLDEGVDVNSANEIGITALWIAAGKEKPEIVKLLVERGADVNARDKIWYQTALSSAIRGSSDELVEYLIAKGANDIEDAAKIAAQMNNASRLNLLLETKQVGQDVLDAMLYSTPETSEAIREILVTAGAQAIPAVPESERKRWEKLIGKYDSDNGGNLELAVDDVGPVIKSGQIKSPLRETSPNHFQTAGKQSSTLVVEATDDVVNRITLRRFTSETLFYPSKEMAEVVQRNAVGNEENSAESTSAPSLNWPQFRGPFATGIGDGQQPPLTWDMASGENVKWKTPIPGLGHSSPIVWGNRVFLTTAVSGVADPEIRIGNYGDVSSVDDLSEHTWHVICVDRDNGNVVWNKQVHQGVPKIKRHLKGSQANCTAATDGTHVVACFGSEGLYCLDFEGNLLWSRDLSSIDSSFALDEQYEWGFAGSPVIHDGLVMVQFDLSKDSFIAAYSLADGNKVWETSRDEIPSWSSPTIWKNSLRTELVTNASQFARSYDPTTGQELWRLAKKSEATIPAPVPYGDLLIICSGNRPIQPIFAIKPGGSGDLSIPENQTTSPFIAWSQLRGGPYMPTPLVYDGYLYVCSNVGVLTCYEVATGRQVYRERIGGASYTASPIVADQRIYFVSESGEVRVIQAGPDFALLAKNQLGDHCMSVPALSAGTLFVRTQHFLIALKRGASSPPPDEDQRAEKP